MYLLAPFIPQNFYKKILRVDSELWGYAPFLGPKQPICPEQNFLVQTTVITFIYLLTVFIVQNLKKFLQRIQNYDNAPFLRPQWSIYPKQMFFWKIITIILIYLLAPFIEQNLQKKPSSGSRVMTMCNLWAQNGPFPQIIFFSENLLMSLVSFSHACLHAKNQILIY